MSERASRQSVTNYYTLQRFRACVSFLNRRKNHPFHQLKCEGCGVDMIPLVEGQLLPVALHTGCDYAPFCESCAACYRSAETHKPSLVKV